MVGHCVLCMLLQEETKDGGEGWCAALYDTVMAPWSVADSKPFASSFFAMRVEKSWRLVRGLVSIFLTTLRLNARIALDPTPAMVERSLPRTTQVAVPIEVIVANAEALLPRPHVRYCGRHLSVLYDSRSLSSVVRDAASVNPQGRCCFLSMCGSIARC